MSEFDAARTGLDRVVEGMQVILHDKTNDIEKLAGLGSVVFGLFSIARGRNMIIPATISKIAT